MENNPKSCELKVPKDSNVKSSTFIVSFSNSSLNLVSSAKLKFFSFRCVDGDGSSSGPALVANNGYLNYEGVPFDENNFDCSKFRYLVGVRNKTNNRMMIYNSNPLYLKPILNSCQQSRESERRNLTEGVDDLLSNYESKGKRRFKAAQRKYSEDISSLSDSMTDMSLVDSREVVNNAESLHNSSNCINFPPRNCDAKTVNQVYKISDIISASDDKRLDEIAENLLQRIPTHLRETDDTFNEYVLHHLKYGIDHVKAKYLVYYHFLIMFSCLLSPDMKKEDPVPLIPEPIKSSLLNCFTLTSVKENGKILRSFPQKMKDKVLAYILVLALFIDDYCVNMSLLQKGTKYKLPKITRTAQALGCYVTKIDNTELLAELKLPLFVVPKKK